MDGDDHGRHAFLELVPITGFAWHLAILKRPNVACIALRILCCSPSNMDFCVVSASGYPYLMPATNRFHSNLSNAYSILLVGNFINQLSFKGMLPRAFGFHQRHKHSGNKLIIICVCHNCACSIVGWN